MADVHEPEVRSYNMSQIKSKDTKPEILVRKFLFSKGFRYRINVKKLPGKPDIVLTKQKIAIFIHGCFWHGHEGCKYFVTPKSRVEFWSEKISKNIHRDINSEEKLAALGWGVIKIWECEIKPNNKANTLENLETRLRYIQRL